MTPINSATQSTSGQACPDSGTVDGTGGDLPSWYQINSGNQAANVLDANACGTTNCYVLTDRGTFDFLSSGQDPAGTIPNLKIVTRNNSASAPGGADELINYFHVYIINPNKPNEQVNVPAAQDFVNFLTGAAFQSQLKTYLDSTADAAVGGPPFVADASPAINVTSGFPATATAGQKVTLTGTVVNSEPRLPEPIGRNGVGRRDRRWRAGPASRAARRALTGASAFRSRRRPPGSYQLSTGQISQVENRQPQPGLRRHPVPSGDQSIDADAPRNGRDLIGQGNGRRRDRLRHCRPGGARRQRRGRDPRPPAGLERERHAGRW